MLRHSARSVTHALQGAWAHAGASTSGREFSSQAGGAFVARLASRGVISMEGDESIDFLQVWGGAVWGGAGLGGGS